MNSILIFKMALFTFKKISIYIKERIILSKILFNDNIINMAIFIENYIDKK